MVSQRPYLSPFCTESFSKIMQSHVSYGCLCVYIVNMFANVYTEVYDH